jgi:hypothetical protein
MINVSGRDPVIIKVPITASASIAQGAILMPGVTADTDIGTAILGTSAIADAIGTLRGAYTYSATNTSNPGGTQYVFVEVELLDQYAPVEVEYDLTDTLAVASTSGTTVTITSLTADIDGTWLYAVSGTGAGEIAWCVSTAAGSAVTKTATGWDSTTTCIKIVPVFSQLVKINTAGTKIGSDAAAGSWTVCVLENWVEAAGLPKQQLDPTKHDNLTLVNPRFYAKLLVRNTCGHTID